MENRAEGLHHITAIAGNPQKNIDFYAGTLGLRLLKKTVNFDDPGTYHFYYGDRTGTPGTVLTFFPWPSPSARGRAGTRQPTAITFSVPAGSLGFWQRRLSEHDVAAERGGVGFDREGLRFSDPDGIDLVLAEVADDPREGRPDGPVPAGYAIRGFHSVTLREEKYAETAIVLLEMLGFAPIGKEGNLTRFAAGGRRNDGAEETARARGFVDVLLDPGGAPGRMGAGAVHHVAFRVSGDSVQTAVRSRIIEAGLNATETIDRKYFRSVYFREPGGVLFELATEAPGFTVDEPLEELGNRLALPQWLEANRESIEKALPAVTAPGRSSNGAAA